MMPYGADVNLSPAIPITINPMKISRPGEAGSEKNMIPKIAVPTAPMPVQTAYPVPIGIVRRVWARKKRLMAMANKVIRLGQSLVKP